MFIFLEDGLGIEFHIVDSGGKVTVLISLTLRLVLFLFSFLPKCSW